MPYLAKRPCSHPGCPSIGVCAKHAKPKSSYRPSDMQRGNSAERGYGYAWRVQRTKYLRIHRFCVMCGNPATDVDHIVPRRAGGTDDESNYQALCHGCHAKKTSMEKTRRMAAKPMILLKGIPPLDLWDL